jgi:hypothetical protein
MHDISARLNNLVEKTGFLPVRGSTGVNSQYVAEETYIDGSNMLVVLGLHIGRFYKEY